MYADGEEGATLIYVLNYNSYSSTR
jgi:hypothetical protein